MERLLIALTMIIQIAATFGCHPRSRSFTAQHAGDPREVVKMHVGAIANSYGLEQVTSSYSQVEIDSAEIRQVVADGSDAIPFLVERMRQPDVAFDTFIRCYAAAERILRTKNASVQIYWEGGCVAAEQPDGSLRFYPGTHVYDDLFRRRVLSDIPGVNRRSRKESPRLVNSVVSKACQGGSISFRSLSLGTIK